MVVVAALYGWKLSCFIYGVYITPNVAFTKFNRDIDDKRSGLIDKGQQTDDLQKEYVTARKSVRKEITKSKTLKWTQVCKNLKDDIFEDRHRIVMNQLKLSNPKITMSVEEKIKAFRELFIRKINVT